MDRRILALLLTLVMPGAQAADAGLRAQGKQVFDRWCVHCHGDGPEYPGTVALQALYQGGKPALLEQRTDLAPAITRQFVRNGVSIMPFFRKTEISDAELDALAAYLAGE
jgi:mono/diheme cytochrome c family protein